MAPSKTAKGAGIGGAAGAAVGAAVGLVQDMKERSQQDQLAQERAYQQEVARKKQEEARLRDQLNEELAIAQGFRITDAELNDAQRRADETASRLAELKAEREWALTRKKQLDETETKIEAELAEIARLEAELAELRGSTSADGG